MSLQTDIIFFRAISADESLMKAFGGRVYNTAIPMPEEDADNVPTPYAIISFDGLTTSGSDKDDPFEDRCDTVIVSVIVTAGKRGELATLAQGVRNAIHDYLTSEDDEDDEERPYNVQMTASGVQYDAYKPCYWQQLRYQCDTINTTTPWE